MGHHVVKSALGYHFFVSDIGDGNCEMIAEPSQGDKLGSPGWADGQLIN
jgi:hypothetical protein